jgi:hypothetical protein
MVDKRGRVRKRLPDEPRCPTCSRILDAYTGIDNDDDDMPPGSLTVCAYCAAPLEWDGKAYHRLEGSALVLARLNEAFLAAETIARQTRKPFK